MVPYTAVIRHEAGSVGTVATLSFTPAPLPPIASCWRERTPNRPRGDSIAFIRLTSGLSLAASASHHQVASLSSRNPSRSQSEGTLRHRAPSFSRTKERSLVREAETGSASLCQGPGRTDRVGRHLVSALEIFSCHTSRPLPQAARRSIGNAVKSSSTSKSGVLRKGRNIGARAVGDGGPGGMAAALPSPPAGFILNEEGEVVLMAPEAKRLLVLEDERGRRLECVIRRTFFSSTNLQFFLLYPLDVPVIIYKVNATTGGLIETEESEVQEAFPQAAYALARRNFHLVLSAFVLTVRGAVCFDQEDVTSINVEYGLGIGSDLAEGVEIASFTHKGTKFVVYTPFDPLLFVAYRDPDTGAVMVAEDEEDLSDAKVEEAIEEEQEYQRMVNEEEEMSQLAKAGQAKARSV